MERHELAHRTLESLRAGNVPWRFPFNQLPHFESIFGTFFDGVPLSDDEVNYAEVDTLVQMVGAKVTHHWRCQRPRCDRPPLDRILLPARSRFRDERQYRASIIHEVLHYIEQPWRVGWIGSYDQAELVAEIGTGFVESFLRLPHDTDNTNIETWLPAWEKGIEANPDYLSDAVAQAVVGVNYLLDLRPRMKNGFGRHSPRHDSAGRER